MYFVYSVVDFAPLLSLRMLPKKKKTAAQSYDKILKENIGQIFLPLTEKQLGIRIRTSEELKDKLQTTLEREADFLRIITTQEGEVFILHLEFQTTDESKMVYRMQEYHAILQKKYGLPVRQLVYYLGEKPTKMRSRLEPTEVYRGFKLLSFHQVAHQEFIVSQVPEEIMLALLADFGEDTAEDVIRKVLERLLQLKTNPTMLEKYLRQMLVLARLRENLNETLDKQITAMALTYDIEKDRLYQQGMAKGIEKGIEQGIEKGEYQKAVMTAQKCLLKGMTIMDTAEITELSIEEVQAIAKRLKQ